MPSASASLRNVGRRVEQAALKLRYGETRYARAVGEFFLGERLTLTLEA